jgi:hypothetical protein
MNRPPFDRASTTAFSSLCQNTIVTVADFRFLAKLEFSVKSVLEGLAVYWMTLSRIPNKIIILLRRLSFNFLWNDLAGNRWFHLCSWQSLARPRKAGGWGLKNLSIFNSVLIACSFWRVVSHDSIWHRVIMDKYLGALPLLSWLRLTTHEPGRASPFWRGLLTASPIILHWL